jgi:hypothetical protein
VTFQQGAGGYAGARDTTLRQAAYNGGGPDVSGATLGALQIDDDSPSLTGADSQSVLRFTGVFSSGGGPVPVGSTIQSATLTLQVTDPGSGFRLHRMLRAWNDTDTWNGWTNGIEANGVEAATGPDVTVGAGNATSNVLTGALNVDVTASVRAWAAGQENWGWALLPFAGGTNGVDFASAEAGTVSFRPKLTVVFTAPAQQASAQLVVAPASGQSDRRPTTGAILQSLLVGPVGPLDAIRLRRVGLLADTDDTLSPA